MQDDEILGKAYDSRLMKRLLGYLRPYGWQVTVALTAIVLKAAADVIGPYLTKTAIDKYLARGIGRPHGLLDSRPSPDPLKGMGQIGMLYIGAQLASFVEHADLPDAFQRIGAEPRIEKAVRSPDAGSQIFIDGRLGEIGADHIGGGFQDDRGQPHRDLPPVGPQIPQQPFHQAAVIGFPEYLVVLH